MPEADEVHAAGVTLLRGCEDFFRLHIEEAQAHGPVAHDAFEVASAAATAVSFFGVECDHHVAAFPYAFGIREASKANAIAQRPDPDEAIEAPLRHRNA